MVRIIPFSVPLYTINSKCASKDRFMNTTKLVPAWISINMATASMDSVASFCIESPKMTESAHEATVPANNIYLPKWQANISKIWNYSPNLVLVYLKRIYAFIKSYEQTSFENCSVGQFRVMRTKFSEHRAWSHEPGVFGSQLFRVGLWD